MMSSTVPVTSLLCHVANSSAASHIRGLTSIQTPSPLCSIVPITMGNSSSNLEKGSTHSSADSLDSAIWDHHRKRHPTKSSTGTKRPTIKKPYYEQRCLLQERESQRSKKARKAGCPPDECKERKLCLGSLRATMKDGTLHVTKAIDHTCDTDIPFVRGGSKNVSNRVLAANAGLTAKTDPSISVRTMGSLAAEAMNIHQTQVSYDKAYKVKKHLLNDLYGLPHEYYGTFVHRLELMRAYDPDTDIYIKVFPDQLPKAYKRKKSFKVFFHKYMCAYEDKPAFNHSSSDGLKLLSSSACMLSDTAREDTLSNHPSTDLTQPLLNSRSTDAAFGSEFASTSAASTSRSSPQVLSTNLSTSTFSSSCLSWDGEFCLRFGAVSVTNGAAKRRCTAQKSGHLDMRCNRPMDACHISGPDRGIYTDVVRPGPACEIHNDTVCHDAENESNNTWSFCVETMNASLGPPASGDAFMSDRMKGLPFVLQHWYPGTPQYDCHFHMKENMSLQENGKATDEDKKRWTNAANHPSLSRYQVLMSDFEDSANSQLVQYCRGSILDGNSTPPSLGFQPCTN